MRRLLTPGWLAFHALALAMVVGMLGLAGWQFSRAADGNALSWGYTFQWPVFAGFVAFIWVREVRRKLGADTASGSPEAPVDRAPPAVRRPVVTRRPAAVHDDADDPELAAYNRYLAWLNENPTARPADYPG